MERKKFIQTILTGAAGMTGLSSFNQFTDNLKEQDQVMPVLFIGHGSPMNGIEDNEFTQRWSAMAKEIPVPKAVLVISAHWLTRGTHVTAMEHPKTIHDFGGFPKELFDVQYPAPGNIQIAEETRSIVKSINVEADHDWGLDHGAWTVTKQMYPEANIPILQLSIDYSKPAAYHFELGKELLALRKKGVLIMGSGNMVHNLRMIAWDKFNVPNYGFDWAIEMNDLFKKKITDGDHKSLMDYAALSKSALLAIPSPDHYLPLMYTLALQQKNESPIFFNDKLVAGSLNMTSVKIG